MIKIALTVTDTDLDNNLEPITSLVQSDFKFIDSTDNVTEITFSGFSNNSNGNYLFWGFDIDTYDPVTNPTYARKEVRVKIQNVFQDGYGTFPLYADGDEPPSASYSVGRVDREGDTVFYWLTYLPDAGHTPPFDPYDPDSAADPDNVLVPNKYIYDNYGKLDASNTGARAWSGANEFDYTPIISESSSEYIVGSPTYENSFVWKKWVEDNFGGVGNNSWPINVNRLVVDSKQTTNVVGKVYNTISAAISYAFGQTPSASSKWEIFIMPHHSTGYTENLTISRFIDLIGIGNVVITGSFNSNGSQTFTGYDSSLKNLWVKGQNANIQLKNFKINDCIFWANGASGEVAFTIDGCQIINSGFYEQNDVDESTANTSKINRIINCFGNIPFTWQSGDKVYSYTTETDTIEF